MFLVDQVGQQCRTRRAAERAPGADQKEHGKNRLHFMQAMQGEGQQRQRAQDLQKVANQDHQAPVVAVGNMARRQQK